MKNLRFLSVLSVCIIAGLVTQAQVTASEAKKIFAAKGNHRSPFKGASEAALTSVNLQFKLGSRETIEKRGAGNIISWAFLEGIEDELMQEIADEYYQRLTKKLSDNGIGSSDAYKNSDDYKKLVEKNADRNRETYKKNWGISKIFTANNAPYIEYPVGMMGAHSAMGNDLKIPVGQIFITIDFAEFILKISKGMRDFQGTITTSSKSTLIPKIRLEGVTQGLKMRGDGSYALFTGKNWGYTNAIIDMGQVLDSDQSYALKTEGVKGMPESMKKFKSDALGDLASIFSAGIVKSGRGVGEFTYSVYADPPLYKAAVLNALDKFNDYLLAYIKDND